MTLITVLLFVKTLRYQNSETFSFSSHQSIADDKY